MKILWITSMLLNDASNDCYNKPGNGLWMDPLIPEFRKDINNELHVIYFQNKKIQYHSKINGIDYYIFEEISLSSDREKIRGYKNILNKILPEVINIWGTEKKRSYYLLQAAKELNIPCVFFIQGLLHEIAVHSKAGFSTKDRIRYTTMRDIYRMQIPIFETYYWNKLAKHEIKILSSKINYMYENQWCVAHCQKYNNGSIGYKVCLPINSIFLDSVGKLNYHIKKEEISIMSNATGYPLKGLHITLKAIARLKKKYSNIKLYIPGTPVIVPTGIIKRQRYPGYYVYISRLIQKLKLEENVVFLGSLSQTKLVDKILSSDVFVVSSSLENHSGSLIEAMALGMPCVTSYIDGLNEYTEHNKNVMIYRFGDYELLAHYIDMLIQDRKIAERIGKAARRTIIENKARQTNTIYNQMIECYVDLLTKKKND